MTATKMKDFPKTSDNFRLSLKMERAIMELLSPNKKNLDDIAKKAGVTARTLRTWFTLPHFQARLREERNKLRQEAFDQLRDILGKAITRLSELVDAQSEGVSLRACQSVIDFNLKAKELELEERLRALEELQERNKGGV